ncbi:hypothetical protein RFI_09386 [Reticulomyxa filosa]|uniref:Uncharacterized protein n=1 Tax=Reticulomyxa filosa TaxID=46433 RepID=X6NNZ8_RETFI|nr:hypothetical protein RFI_09386 [Reticulomyxa filosa]|eukprot:ETO27746.1 hypothetical protein RFI_09386 [Reticulomyxa filosa]
MTALNELGYKCAGPWINTCKFHKMHSHFENADIHEQMYLTSSDDILIHKLVEIDYLFDYFRIMTAFGRQFGDGPWLFLYPYFDTWYPNDPPSFDKMQWHFGSNFHRKFDPYHVWKKKGNNNDSASIELAKSRPFNVGKNDKFDILNYVNRQSSYVHANSKYILTIRQSTWDLVNSDLKMYCRVLHLYDVVNSKHFQCNQSQQYTQQQVDTLFDNYRTRFGTSFKDYMMLIARRYELHNQNVVQYFQSRKQIHNLLVINLFDKSIDHWSVLKNFLGCDFSLPNQKEFPRSNVGEKVVSEFIPRDYPLNWKNYQYKMWQPQFTRY